MRSTTTESVTRNCRTAMADTDNEVEFVEKALAAIPDGYTAGWLEGRRWGTTVKRSSDGRRLWLFAEDLAGDDIVSFNLYRTAQGKPALRPCEMSSDKIFAFILGYRLDTDRERDLA